MDLALLTERYHSHCQGHWLSTRVKGRQTEAVLTRAHEFFALRSLPARWVCLPAVRVLVQKRLSHRKALRSVEHHHALAQRQRAAEQLLGKELAVGLHILAGNSGVCVVCVAWLCTLCGL